MKTYFLLGLLLLVGPVFAQAQAADKAAQSDSLIKVVPVYSGRYTSTIYTMNDEPLTAATVRKLLWKYPESAAEMRKYRGQRRLSILLLPVFLGGLLVGHNQVEAHPERTGSAFSRSPVPLSISLAAFFGSIALAVANDHYGKAIEAYNRHFKR